MTGDPLGMGPWKKGDRVRVKAEYRGKFTTGTTAERGETLVVTGPNGSAVGIGPKQTLDYAYHGELEVSHG